MAVRKKERSDLEKVFFQIKHSFTTEDLESLYQNVKDNIIAPYAAMINALPPIQQLEVIAVWDKVTKTNNGRGNQAPGRFGKAIATIRDVVDYMNWWIDFYHQIKTEEQFQEQLKRVERLLYADYQIELPIVVRFDYQVTDIRSIIMRPPTYYSYWDDELETTQGKGSCVIAFCSYNSLLTDEELMAVIKHEFGHIVQGHCIAPPTFTATEQEYRNQAMDVSINIAFTDQEKENLIKAAAKMWGEGATGCISLAGKKEFGGYDLPGKISPPGDWPYVLAELRYAFGKKTEDQDQQQGKGKSQQGQGSGAGGSGSNIEEINAGDHVKIRGSKKYGKVVSVDPVTGKAEIEEYTDDEWKEIKKTLKPTE